MRNSIILAISALALVGCGSSNTTPSQIKVEYVKNAEVVVITDEMLGMVEFENRSDRVSAQRKLQREHFALAATIWAEARGDGFYGMQAVAYVIANRMRMEFRTDGTIEGTVRWNKQFSCWNKGDPNLPKMNMKYLENSKGSERYQWETAKQIAYDIMKNGVENDTTAGSLFYHADYVNPNWKKPSAQVAEVGSHIFYTSAR